MISWARRRQLWYGGGAFLLILLVFSAPLISRRIVGPSCTDRRQNGSEAGVDCGGPLVGGCALLCPNTAREPRVVWQRAFDEGGGVGSALLYGENPNTDAGTFDARYHVKVYDRDGLLIAEKDATGAIAPGGAFAVFAPNLFVGSRLPARAVFTQAAPFAWRRDAPPQSAVRASGIRLSLSPQTRVDAQTENTLARPVSLVAVAILYDERGNALGASQTVAELPPRGSAPLSFVWRAPFELAPVRAEVIVAAREVK